MSRPDPVQIKIGNVKIGGGLPVIVQSMTKTDTSDIRATVNQIKQLERAGCKIVRVAVPDMNAVKVLKKIKKRITIPLVADIHFDYKLAIESIKQGVDKIRINPGNIGSRNKVKEVVLAAKDAKIPIRIGLNSGSIKKMRGNVQEVMVETAIDYIKMFEDWGFFDMVLSLKSSDVFTTIEAYRMLAKKVNYPLHLGITESGPPGAGTVKSAIGIGILLMENIGDTIRVSLTADPVEEVKTAYQILQATGKKVRGIDIISCPTCARCKINLVKIVEDFENEISKHHLVFNRSIKVSIMGCEVNGPGEARHADIGIAGGRNTGLLFKHGKVIKKIKPENWVKELISGIKDISGKL
ncbi:MAG: 4-hydroxy-3-methylbut-2-en-1-yl diphosphate synthase [Elusimicrobia bacterium CG1_02_37_114]|nr:MAG: 4-hydroxy-3-methylbut-2-en-1-yl diphosphate synthase [Elusimicrobia bacterium CG1_02_37_114]PIV52926.1 MAG: 4-hydroxy-3-methylbut-2-en-1-yl diphosphate synthase [Elusimicrobia bacterium CG02_land_8_20_14_3_00_37_13]PIZ14026.1 MAG: 4-hydroxy-3-methylbut-2-en-1-yl diphosphate synthase [Elusimicrobia bacterium CG_4_10_14_0_8_um_filter_37_32]